MSLQDDHTAASVTPVSPEDRGAAIRKAAEHHVRLHILQLLVKSGRQGMLVVELRERIGVVQSTTVYHLRKLEKVGAIRRTPQGVATRQWLTPAALKALGAVLTP